MVKKYVINEILINIFSFSGMAHFQTFLKYLTKKPYQPMTGPKSSSVTFAVSHINGTEIEIWAGFGAVDSTEKKIGQIMSNF